MADLDDQLDEDFNQKPVVVDTPAPLSNDELSKINELIKNKSNKELVDYISKLILTNTDNLSDVQKLQMQHNSNKMYEGNSKRVLIETIGKFINQNNKNIIFDDASKLKTMNEEQLSREELRQKLRNKLKSNSSNSKQNLTKMYEKLQEELQNSELGDSLNPVEENLTKKKKKKLDPKKLQNQLVSQMANLMKNNPGGFSGTPNSA